MTEMNTTMSTENHPTSPTAAAQLAAVPHDIDTSASATTTIVIHLARQRHELTHQPGDTVLEAARRIGLRPPFSCEAGNCATCMAHLDEGTVRMRANNALPQDEVDDGWILTCQSLPTSERVVVNYDA